MKSTEPEAPKVGLEAIVGPAEAQALKRYFDAHLAMHAADNEAKFGAAYVAANKARDDILKARA